MTIKEFLQHKRITGTDFAMTIGVSDSSLSMYCSGKRTPGPNVARRIVMATGGMVGFEDLYMIEEKEQAAA